MTSDAARAPRSRTTTLLIVLVVLGALALLACVICGVGGYLWSQQTVEEMRAAGVRIEAEADAFAAAHAQSECVEESLRRSDACGQDLAIMCRAEASIFLRHCAERATPTPGFCDGAPPLDDIMGIANWSVATCARLGHQGDPHCPQHVRPIVEICAQP